MIEVKKHFTFGNIFGETFNLYFQNFLRLIVPAVIFFGATSILVYLSYSQVFRMGFESAELGSTNFFMMISFFVIGILFLPYNYYQIQVASNCYLNKTESPSELILLSFKSFFPLFGMSLLFMLGIMGAAFALIIPSYILMIGWSLLYVVFVIEGIGARASLKRSWTLTKGFKGKLFLIYLILIVLLYAVMIIGMLLGQESLTAFFANYVENSASSDMSSMFIGFSVLYALGYSLLFPLFTAFLIVVYYNILKDKEGFATEQLAEGFMS
jgi:hypothetical protein